MSSAMDIYISSSWKNRERVRKLAQQLRELDLTVYDFTDPSCRRAPEIPPEKFPEQFDPERHFYRTYLDRPEWRTAVEENRAALDECRIVVLLLPCGNDAHADWAYAVGKGKFTAVYNNPRAGDRTPTHLWADLITDDLAELKEWVANPWRAR